MSSSKSTRPSEGKSFSGIFASKRSTLSRRVAAVTVSYSTTSKPWSLSHANCAARELLKSTPSASTKEKAWK